MEIITKKVCGEVCTIIVQRTFAPLPRERKFVYLMKLYGDNKLLASEFIKAFAGKNMKMFKHWSVYLSSKRQEYYIYSHVNKRWIGKVYKTSKGRFLKQVMEMCPS